MWLFRRMDEVPPEYIDVSSKRFRGQRVLLYELIDGSYATKRFFRGCSSPLLVINKVIRAIRYPLDVFGNPTDLHYYQAFRRFWGSCHKTYRNDFDFFQFAHETAWLGMGDCEDSSILTGAGLELIKSAGLELDVLYPAYRRSIDYFVVFGRVWKDDILLGYHAWVIWQGEDGHWRLVETTLDTPYSSVSEMEIINTTHNKWDVGELMYEGLIMFNKEKLAEWASSGETKMPLDKYLKMGKRDKDTRKKYKLMGEVYKKRGKSMKVR